MAKRHILGLLYILSNLSMYIGDTVTVQTTYGPIVGLKRISHVNEKFISFRGVPYGRPPVGTLRFTDPQPPVPWHLPRDATKTGNIPYTVNRMRDNGIDEPISKLHNEDCLLLNVHTKNLKPHTLRPVMLWLHGGGFRVERADEYLYGPDYLLRHDVVFVSVNYRLGAIGFLSIDDPAVGVPGNAGLKDQSLALRWVRDNIQQFGGDPDNVTLFGDSAGAASIQFHMCSEMSRGLFHRAIMQSGSMLNPWVDHPNNNWGVRLAIRLGWNGQGGSQGAVDYLRTANATEIVHTQGKLAVPSELTAGIDGFGPGAEPYRSEQTFFDVAPEQLAQQCWATQMPLLIGANADEGYVYWKHISRNVELLQSPIGINSLIPMDVLRAKGNHWRDIVLDYYYNYTTPTKADIMPIVRMYGDRQIWQGILNTVEKRLRTAAAPTYLYRFMKDSRTLNAVKLGVMGVDRPGVCHQDDVLYLFRPKITPNIQPNSSEEVIMKRMTDIWTHFARTGNPTAATSVAGLNWQPASADDAPYYRGLIINDRLSVEVPPECERVQFWNYVLAL